ncbi:MAG: hypothetical protein JSR91_17540 [Proteobacteria bacterium]|nr:hypothetical protein [Pseudomonadota bacterium]
MAYLDLTPAITALRSRPEEFEFSNNTLHHLTSRHSFRFAGEGDVQIDARCDCSLLRATPDQNRILYAAYREWYDTYWRSVEINREFATHFQPPALWRRLAIWLLRRLLSLSQSPMRHPVQATLPLRSVG